MLQGEQAAGSAAAAPRINEYCIIYYIIDMLNSIIFRASRAVDQPQVVQVRLELMHMQRGLMQHTIFIHYSLALQGEQAVASELMN